MIEDKTGMKWDSLAQRATVWPQSDNSSIVPQKLEHAYALYIICIAYTILIILNNKEVY